MLQLGSYDAHTESFDNQFPVTQIDLDRLEIGVLRQQADHMILAFKTFYRDLVIQACDNDLPILSLWGTVHGQQVTIENTCIAHTVAFNA